MTTQYAFNRKYRLLVGESKVAGGALEITDLQIQFNIKRTDAADSDKASIVITNLSHENIEKFMVKDKIVSLEVGWEGTSLIPIFLGVISGSKTQRNNADVDTTIELEDTGNVLRDARTNRQFPNNVSVNEIFTAIAEKDMGLAAETSNGTLPVTKGIYKQYPLGWSNSGNSKVILQKLAKENGLQFYVTNGVAYLIPFGNAHPKDVYPLFTPANGLLGSPYKGIPKAKAGKTNKSPEKSKGITFDVLLYPALYPKDLVAVQSDLLEGVYQIASVEHSGSFDGEDWKTSIETTTTDGEEIDPDEAEIDRSGNVIE
jgi:hypothetical protein